MLTGEQREALATAGWVRVPGVVAPDVVGAMADAVWASLAVKGVDRADRSTWPVGFVGKHQGLRRRGAFDAFGTAPATRALVDELLGATSERWGDRQAWGPALVTFPEPGRWTVPHKGWHFDLPGRADPDPARAVAVRLFGYVSDVVPCGGGTMVVEGSHELVRRMVAAAPGHDAGGSPELRKRLLAAHPWFAALSTADADAGAGTGGMGGSAVGTGGSAAGERRRRFMEDGDEIDGVRVRVAELTAAAGDIVVMHPWTLHSLSTNSADTPRFMVTHSIYPVGSAAVAD